MTFASTNAPYRAGQPTPADPPPFGREPALVRKSHKPLRIALVQTQAENAGAQEISRLIAGGLEARGHAVRQIFFFRRTASFDDVGNAMSCCTARPSGPLGLLRLLLALRREFRRLKPDAVISFQHYGNLIAAPVARSAGVRAIIANQVTPRALMAKLARAADGLLGRMGLYDRIVVNSRETEAEYADHPPVYRRRLVRIDHGFQDKAVQVAKADARQALGLPPGVPLLGCVARLHPVKQLDAIIRVLPINRDQHLALAGQGSEAGTLEALADQLGVRDRVHFLGELASERVGLLLAGLDCFVFASAAESFGLAPVEAAQAGVPVVANAIPILEDVLSFEGQPCALFVDATDPQALASAVRRVLEDGALAARLQACGRRLRERYPVDVMVEAYVGLIESIVEEKTCASKSASTAAASGAGTALSGTD